MKYTDGQDMGIVDVGKHLGIWDSVPKLNHMQIKEMLKKWLLNGHVEI